MYSKNELTNPKNPYSETKKLKIGTIGNQPPVEPKWLKRGEVENCNIEHSDPKNSYSDVNNEKFEQIEIIENQLPVEPVGGGEEGKGRQ